MLGRNESLYRRSHPVKNHPSDLVIGVLGHHLGPEAHALFSVAETQPVRRLGLDGIGKLALKNGLKVQETLIQPSGEEGEVDASDSSQEVSLDVIGSKLDRLVEVGGYLEYQVGRPIGVLVYSLIVHLAADGHLESNRKPLVRLGILRIQLHRFSQGLLGAHEVAAIQVGFPQGHEGIYVVGGCFEFGLKLFDRSRLWLLRLHRRRRFSPGQPLEALRSLIGAARPRCQLDHPGPC